MSVGNYIALAFVVALALAGYFLPPSVGKYASISFAIYTFCYCLFMAALTNSLFKPAKATAEKPKNILAKYISVKAVLAGLVSYYFGWQATGVILLIIFAVINLSSIQNGSTHISEVSNMGVEFVTMLSLTGFISGFLTARVAPNNKALNAALSHLPIFLFRIYILYFGQWTPSSPANQFISQSSYQAITFSGPFLAILGAYIQSMIAKRTKA